VYNHGCYGGRSFGAAASKIGHRNLWRTVKSAIDKGDELMHLHTEITENVLRVDDCWGPEGRRWRNP